MKLFVQINGEYHAVDSVLGNQKPGKTVSVRKAIDTYISTMTVHKCKKSQASEKLYFHRLEDFLKLHDIHYINDCTTIILRQFETECLKTNKASSVNRRFNTFRNFFKCCVEWGYIEQNPCAKIKKRVEESNPYAPWPDDLFDRFIRLTDGVYTKIFLFLFLTGCRGGECMALKWEHIGTDKLKLKCGKTKGKTRDFPISPDLRDLLSSIEKDSAYVFSINGHCPTTDNLYQYAKHRLNFLEASEYSPYGLRHAFGTSINDEGGSAHDVALINRELHSIPRKQFGKVRQASDWWPFYVC